MKTTYLLTVLIAIFYLTSCKQNKNVTDKDLIEIYVNVSQNNGHYDISKDIELDFDLVALETNDSCLVGYIKKIIYENNKYYIQDDKRSAIFIFNNQGQFISKLDRKGGGPDEYFTVSSFVMKGEDIWIHDDVSKRLICYDPNFNKRQEIHINFPSFNMNIINDDIYLSTNWLWYGEDSYQLIKCNTETRQITDFLPFNKVEKEDFAATIKKKAFANWGDSCLFTNSYDNKLYRITSKSVSPQYKYTFSERFEDIPLSYNEIESKSEKIRGIDAIFQTKNSILLQYEDNKIPKIAIYSKSNKSCKTYPSILINSDFANFQSYNYFFTKKGEIISIYNPEELIEYGDNIYDKEKFKDDQNKVKFERIMQNASIADNPIIIKYKLNHDSKL